MTNDILNNLPLDLAAVFKTNSQRIRLLYIRSSDSGSATVAVIQVDPVDGAITPDEIMAQVSVFSQLDDRINPLATRSTTSLIDSVVGTVPPTGQNDAIATANALTQSLQGDQPTAKTPQWVWPVQGVLITVVVVGLLYVLCIASDPTPAYGRIRD